MAGKLSLQTSAAALLAALSACSVSTPVRVTMPAAGALPNAVAIDLEKDAPAQKAEFTRSLAQALAAKGVRVSADSPYHLLIALSSQDSASGTTQDPGKDPQSVIWRSAPRKKSIFDGCRPRRIRAVAIGSVGLTANPGLHAEAELDSCKSQATELDRLAVALAEAITRR